MQITRCADTAKMQLILVDHNEVSQSIRALEEAELIEVIDHHRVGTQSTITPIPFYIDCVGSTSTLISERIIASGLMPPPAIVALLLAGVISDTLLLASPTTTKRDHIIVERLMELVRKSGILPYKDHKEFGDALFSVSSSLSVLSPDKIVTTDLKLYNMNEKQFGLAQIEVGNLNELGPRVKEISEALEELCESKVGKFGTKPCGRANTGW